MRPPTRTSLVVFMVLTSVLGVAQAALAQAQSSSPDTRPTPGRVEIGGGLGTIGDISGYGMVAPTAQVTLNFTRQHALQIAADARTERRAGYWEVSGIYSLLYRHTVRDRENTRGFLLLGGAGLFGISHRAARTYTAPAYTMVRNGVSTQVPERTEHVPKRNEFGFTMPASAVVGIGGEVRVARRLILGGQCDVAMTIYRSVAVKMGVTATVPIGRVQ